MAANLSGTCPALIWLFLGPLTRIKRFILLKKRANDDCHLNVRFLVFKSPLVTKKEPFFVILSPVRSIASRKVVSATSPTWAPTRHTDNPLRPMWIRSN